MFQQSSRFRDQVCDGKRRNGTLGKVQFFNYLIAFALRSLQFPSPESCVRLTCSRPSQRLSGTDGAPRISRRRAARTPRTRSLVRAEAACVPLLGDRGRGDDAAAGTGLLFLFIFISLFCHN